jgi:phage shock protein E
MKTLTKELIESATIIDVRTDEEVAQGIFAGAIHICLDDLASEMSQFEEMKAPVILYCRSGNRSGQALRYLEEHGFSNLYNGINIETLEKITA